MKVSNAPGVSVIICCYNSAKRLAKTLRYLAYQEVPDYISWEIVVVNNASTDETSIVAKEEWEKYALSVPICIVDQPVAGLIHARNKGFEVSQYEYCLFCDDDNWLDSNYVSVVYEIMEWNDRIGALGGWSTGEFEIEPEEWIKPFLPMLVIGKKIERTGIATQPLYGAGIVIRKSAFQNLKNIGFTSLLKGREGKNIAGGEDYELNFALKKAGYIWFFDERLHFVHYIPAERVKKDYFLKIIKSDPSQAMILMFYEQLLGEDVSFYAMAGKCLDSYIKGVNYALPRLIFRRHVLRNYINLIQSIRKIYFFIRFWRRYAYDFCQIKSLYTKIDNSCL